MTKRKVGPLATCGTSGGGVLKVTARARKDPARLPKVGDRFVSHGVEWRVSETALRVSRDRPARFMDYTLCLDRVPFVLSSKCSSEGGR